MTVTIDRPTTDTDTDQATTTHGVVIVRNPWTKPVLASGIAVILLAPIAAGALTIDSDYTYHLAGAGGVALLLLMTFYMAQRSYHERPPEHAFKESR
ncbi:hypothetical protein [Polymorphospora lycopeni]|uniref:Uncharacterized protein n=1 Tax=Polymorphospora lycopeni TaxID=3140240 RepID=A0ABV5CLL5_9ACTN